jgi:ketose-bisphosphate aldolase
MPIANLKPFLDDARTNKYCIGSFNVCNIETLEGVIEAAINMKTPVVCAVYEPQLKFSNLEIFSNLVKDVSDKVNVPVILHLDHATEISSIVNAIKYGFTSIMYDGPPGLDFQEKINRTKKVVEIAHSVGLMVEAEVDYITRIGQDKNISGANLTNAEIAQEFVELTGIDILAPAIGSIHGLIEGKATINLELLKNIKERTNCYISMHGGSGISDETMREAINIGLNKASVYTYISHVAIQKLKNLIDKESLDLTLILNEIREGFKEVVENRLKTFRSVNICSFQPNVCQFSFISGYIDTNTQKTNISLEDSLLKTTGFSKLNDKDKYNIIINQITQQVIENLKR